METGLMMLCGAGIAAVSALAASVYTAWRLRKKLMFLVEALEDNECNIRFKEKGFISRHFNEELNCLREVFDQRRAEVAAREEYYGRLLNLVKTGILVVDQTAGFCGSVIYRNASALHLLGMTGITHLRELRLVSDQLERDFLDCTEETGRHATFFNERGKVTLSLAAIKTLLNERQVKVVVFNDITAVMEHNEDLSWDKLIRVLTHEIMNTVMPIASLSHTLSDDLSQDGGYGEEERRNVQQGLHTIADAADGLVHFVEGYRSLTRVAAPVKRAFSVRELMDKVMLLTQEQVAAAGAEMVYMELSEDILLYADEGQLSQVMVNLVRNALQAGARQIRVTALINAADAVVIRLANDGLPISKANKEEIFVPFYTTKPEGSGIGLSLSRQIMRMHNGSLLLEKSDEQSTSFLLVFR